MQSCLLPPTAINSYPVLLIAAYSNTNEMCFLPLIAINIYVILLIAAYSNKLLYGSAYCRL